MAFGNISGMGSNPAGHYTQVNIIGIGHANMFSRGDITEKVGTVVSSNGAADGSGNMIRTGTGISRKTTKDKVGSTAT